MSLSLFRVSRITLKYRGEEVNEGEEESGDAKGEGKAEDDRDSKRGGRSKAKTGRK